MNTLHFKYAVEVERCGSITQAADNLFMAQPNLSKAIKELEDTLGIVIFERSSKGMTPTARGREFLVYARNILLQLQGMESLSTRAEEPSQSFSISIPRGSYIADGFTRFVAALDKHGGIDVKIKETNSVQTVANVVEGRFRLGIIRYQTVNEPYFLDFLREKGLRHEPVWEFEYVLLMPGRHPLADQPDIQPGDLAPYTEIVHGDTTVPYLPAADLRQRGAQGDKRIVVFERSTQFDLLARIDEAYMWVSPIPESMLERNGLVQRKCHGKHDKYKDELIYLETTRLSRLDHAFIDKLFEARNRVAFV